MYLATNIDDTFTSSLRLGLGSNGIVTLVDSFVIAADRDWSWNLSIFASQYNPRLVTHFLTFGQWQYHNPATDLTTSQKLACISK